MASNGVNHPAMNEFGEFVRRVRLLPAWVPLWDDQQKANHVDGDEPNFFVGRAREGCLFASNSLTNLTARDRPLLFYLYLLDH
jgi:hypothetical protein